MLDVTSPFVTIVTGRSLVSMILVEAMEELKNLEVILLTFFGLVAASVLMEEDVVISLMVVGLGVIGILLMATVVVPANVCVAAAKSEISAKKIQGA